MAVVVAAAAWLALLLCCWLCFMGFSWLMPRLLPPLLWLLLWLQWLLWLLRLRTQIYRLAVQSA